MSKKTAEDTTALEPEEPVAEEPTVEPIEETLLESAPEPPAPPAASRRPGGIGCPLMGPNFVTKKDGA